MLDIGIWPDWLNAGQNEEVQSIFKSLLFGTKQFDLFRYMSNSTPILGIGNKLENQNPTKNFRQATHSSTSNRAQKLKML